LSSALFPLELAVTEGAAEPVLLRLMLLEQPKVKRVKMACADAGNKTLFET
jgi:hypothetical protein